MIYWHALISACTNTVTHYGTTSPNTNVIPLICPDRYPHDLLTLCVYELAGTNTHVAETPPLQNVSFKKVIVDTLNNVGPLTRCPQPLNSVRLMVSYIAQCLHNDFFEAHSVQGGGVLATCVPNVVTRNTFT